MPAALSLAGSSWIDIEVAGNIVRVPLTGEPARVELGPLPRLPAASEVLELRVGGADREGHVRWHRDQYRRGCRTHRRRRPRSVLRAIRLADRGRSHAARRRRGTVSAPVGGVRRPWSARVPAQPPGAAGSAGGRVQRPSRRGPRRTDHRTEGKSGVRRRFDRPAQHRPFRPGRRSANACRAGRAGADGCGDAGRHGRAGLHRAKPEPGAGGSGLAGGAHTRLRHLEFRVAPRRVSCRHGPSANCRRCPRQSAPRCRPSIRVRSR